MTKVHSTPVRTNRNTDKPKKPHPDFPLTCHPTGRWCKKVRGKLHYFGKAIADNGASAQTALELWLEQKDDLLAGRVPRPKGESGPTLRNLANRFLTAKKRLVDSGELSPHTWKAYFDISENAIAFLGKDRLLSDIQPTDFERLRSNWSAKWGPTRLKAEINRLKVVFNFAWKNGIIDKPIRFGEGFASPSAKVLRLHRAAQGPNMFERDELRTMLESASQPLRTMILLGANCGFGNSDLGSLPLSALDLEGGWIDFHRGKTGINRRCPLWAETVQALREWLARRPQPKNESDVNLVFLTVRGVGWDSVYPVLAHQMRKLTDRLGIMGRSFYSLRHGFETVGGESIDQVAVSAIMGHADQSMSANYRERISDARLRAVGEHVRQWLFGTPTTTQEGGAV
ncbi:MAG: hypothetical protein EXS16_12545 [Gemmataceae bacterium]|nr:hypothetical protein [Gemmataceae bacterium]